MATRMNIEEALERLEPRKVRLEGDAFGDLKLTIEGKGEFTKVKIIQSFPFSGPYRLVAFRDQDNDEIGIMDNARDLDRGSLKVLRAEIQKAYFVPKITRISNIDEESGSPKWVVETDRGQRSFELKSRLDARSVGGGRVLITDIDGNRYEIPNRYALDTQSQNLLEEEI